MTASSSTRGKQVILPVPACPEPLLGLLPALEPDRVHTEVRQADGP